MQEGHCPPGVSWARRLHEMLAEAKRAEETGWDWYGVGEQHFAREEAATVSSPEIFHAALARETHRIRLRPMSTNLIRYNHPIRIAEQVATLDVLSDGRAELGGARSNNPFTLEAFGVDPKDTRAQRDEALRILAGAWRNEEFSHRGEMYDVPPRTLAPRPLQRPTPPVHISATGPESHEVAANLGIGVMTGNSILGWEFLASCVDAYKTAVRTAAEPIFGWVNNRLAFSSIGVSCAATRDEAIAVGGPVALQFVDVVIRFNVILARRSADYAYLGQVEKLEAHRDDLDYLMAAAPYITIGTPDDLIARAAEIHAMGADDLIYRLDGMGHEENLRAIEMIGRHVIPAVHEFPEHDGSTPYPGTDR
jgi:alkanesulfonate monooxygenase SsuD/methylene tetrahydromethanopterin reductase-like flavin-dependent oxidoreductase (luciferase family)